MGNKFLVLESALNMMLNIHIGRENRLQNLKVIEAYAGGLVHLSEEHKKVLGSVFQAFRHELLQETVNEECIGGYTRIMKDILNFNRSLKGRKCIVFGDNWLAREIGSKMRATSCCVFDWHTVHPAYMDEYDLYLLCDEPLKVYDLPAGTDEKKIVKLWDYLKYKFVVFPSFYEVYMECRRQREKKVKCIITGGTNIKNAVNTRLLHVTAASLANNSQDIFYDYQMFCHALQNLENVELQYAIIGLAPYSLHYDASRSKVEWRRCLVYYPVVKTMHNCNGAKQLIELFEEEDRKIGALFDREYLMSLYEIYAAGQKPSTETGEGVFDSAECTAFHLREISDLYHKPFPDVVEENKKILEEYVRCCKEKGIRALFMIPPYPDWYREHMNRQYYEELIEYLNLLCAHYGAALMDMTRFCLPDGCFADYSNVNCVGAVKVAGCINEGMDV